MELKGHFDDVNLNTVIFFFGAEQYMTLDLKAGYGITFLGSLACCCLGIAPRARLLN